MKRMAGKAMAGRTRALGVAATHALLLSLAIFLAAADARPLCSSKSCRKELQGMKFNVVALPAGRASHWRVLNLLLGDPAWPVNAVGTSLRSVQSSLQSALLKLSLPLPLSAKGSVEDRRRSLRLREESVATELAEEASEKRREGGDSLSSAAQGLERRVLTEGVSDSHSHPGYSGEFTMEEGLLGCRSEACMKAQHRSRGTHLLESTLSGSDRTVSTSTKDGTGSGFTNEEGLLACRGLDCLEGMHRASGAHLMEQAMRASEGAAAAGADAATGFSEEQGLLACRDSSCSKEVHRMRGTHLLEQTVRASSADLSSAGSGFQEVEGLLACRGEECLRAIHQARGTHLLEALSSDQKEKKSAGKKSKKQKKLARKAHRVQVASVQGLGEGEAVGMATQGRKALGDAEGGAALGERVFVEDAEDSVPKNWVRRGVVQGYVAGNDGASDESHEGPGELPPGEEGEEFENSQTEDDVVPLADIIP